MAYILKTNLDWRVCVVSRFAGDKVASRFCRVSPREFDNIDLSSEVKGYKVAWATVLSLCPTTASVWNVRGIP